MNPALWSEAGRRCPKCGSPLQLSDIHDAVACLHCDEWLEAGCTDPCCWARCASRPAQPSASAAMEPGVSTSPAHFFSRLVGRASDPDVARRLIAEATQGGDAKKPPDLRALFPRRSR